ncbi:MAG: tRNA (guanosine(46)-N7)-methyltransferase TrmB [Mycoplasmoidaceae bacterium]|nr:tRNA (guanosine(46)-N7)-methyltransferase TrmB [Mycoplasmoidaceae bacterium]
MGRLRTNINAPELIKNYSNYCELADLKLPKKPIYLEIGSGKGDFLIAKALNNKKKYYIGIEKYSTVILKALMKIDRADLKINNLCFVCADAINLNFNHKLSGLYLNFSDPWPKKRHAKRRLTSPSFLSLYKKILKKNALVEFKTDNSDLYQYTLETLLNRKDISLVYQTKDLYQEITKSINKDNVQTEYEKKFI